MRKNPHRHRLQWCNHRKIRVLVRGSTIISIESGLRGEHLETGRELGFMERVADGIG